VKIDTMKKQLKVEITEMFCAQADPERTYFGCIKRGRHDNGEPFVFSRIVMPDGLLCASDNNQDDLSKNLDTMAIQIMDKGLHNDQGKFTTVFGSKLFQN
jgi:hypothetical protein